MQALIEFPTAKITPIKGHSMEPGRDIETLKEFHRVLRRSLRPPVYSVFCAIEDHAGTNPPPGIPLFTCFASDKTLAEEASVSRETVVRAIKELKGLNLITVEDRQGYTCLIWPLVTNQGYLSYMKEQVIRDAERELQKDTCNTKPQGVCQKATGGVSESHTNETNLKKPNNETKEDMAVADETGPATIDLPDISVLEKTIKVLLPTVEAVDPGPTTPNQQDREGDSENIHIPTPPKPRSKVSKPKKPKSESPYTKDARLLTWRDFAIENDYDYWPNRELQKMIIDHIPPDKLPRWKFTIKDWLLHSHKVQNISGMVKVFWFGWEAFYSGQADNRPLPLVSQVQERETVHAST